MLPSQLLNVFRGPDALQQYYDPDKAPPTPLVELPAMLNPFIADGVHIFAKLHSALPAANVKSLPALNMLREAGFGQPKNGSMAGKMDGTARHIVEYSSGSTVISLAILGNVFGLDSVAAYLSNKTSAAKLKLRRFFGLDLYLFGGPSQPDPYDERGGIMAARQYARSREGVFNPNQYENDSNYRAHMKWTAPQILRQLPDTDIVAAGMGTGRTMTGTGLAMKALKPSVLRLGVTTAPGDRVPGPRSEALLAPVQFPWRQAIDAMEWVGSTDSYSLSMRLCRFGLLVGPSSGFALQGLLQYLQKAKEQGQLDLWKASTGRDAISGVFVCCDGPFQYIDDYFTKLPSGEFGRAYNKELIGVDLYRYDDSWELEPREIRRAFYDLGPIARAPSVYSCAETTGASRFALPNKIQAPKAGPLVIDLRRQQDSIAQPWPFAVSDCVSLSLQSLGASTPCPFQNAVQLRAQWLELEQLLSHQSVLDELSVTLNSFLGPMQFRSWSSATPVTRAGSLALSSANVALTHGASKGECSRGLKKATCRRKDITSLRNVRTVKLSLTI